MSRDLQAEVIEKYPIPGRPDAENYRDKRAYELAEAEYQEIRQRMLKERESWVERERVEEARKVAMADVERTKKRKLNAEQLSCTRCLQKDIPCERSIASRGVTCVGCRRSKARCEWPSESRPGPEAASTSGAAPSRLQHCSRPSAEALREIAEAIRETGRWQKEQAQRTLESIERLTAVLVENADRDHRGRIKVRAPGPVRQVSREVVAEDLLDYDEEESKEEMEVS